MEEDNRVLIDDQFLLRRIRVLGGCDIGPDPASAQSGNHPGKVFSCDSRPLWPRLPALCLPKHDQASRRKPLPEVKSLNEVDAAIWSNGCDPARVVGEARAIQDELSSQRGERLKAMLVVAFIVFIDLGEYSAERTLLGRDLLFVREYILGDQAPPHATCIEGDLSFFGPSSPRERCAGVSIGVADISISTIIKPVDA